MTVTQTDMTARNIVSKLIEVQKKQYLYILQRFRICVIYVLVMYSVNSITQTIPTSKFIYFSRQPISGWNVLLLMPLLPSLRV